MKPPAKESPAPVGSNTDFERIRGREKDRRRREHERAVLALLDDDVLGTALP